MPIAVIVPEPPDRSPDTAVQPSPLLRVRYNRNVPKYRTCGLIGSMTSGAMNCPRSDRSMPLSLYTKPPPSCASRRWGPLNPELGVHCVCAHQLLASM